MYNREFFFTDVPFNLGFIKNEDNNDFTNKIKNIRNIFFIKIQIFLLFIIEKNYEDVYEDVLEIIL